LSLLNGGKDIPLDGSDRVNMDRGSSGDALGENAHHERHGAEKRLHDEAIDK
jgi:hypothetical protein